MTWFFTLGRSEGFPANYGEQFSAAHVDVLVAGLILAFVIIAVGFVSVLLAYTVHGRWLLLSLYVTCSLCVGGILLVGNFGHGWEVAQASILSPYKPASNKVMVGEIGLHISLHGVNITLQGNLLPPNHEKNQSTTTHEIIDYNEHYSWEWAQGRFGFGPYAGRISREFRASVLRGTPTPILVTAEYFTFDGEGLRFGRHYRLAGYYTHWCLWLGFWTWMLANVALFMVVRLGAILLTCTGLAQIIAILLWSCIRNSIELSIPFESADGAHDVMLATKYGASYWLVLANGVVCTLLGIVLFVLDDFYKERLCVLFGIDPLSVYVYEYQAQEEDEDDMDQDTDIDKPADGDNTVRRRLEGSEGHTSIPTIVQTRHTNGKSIYNAFVRKSQPHNRSVRGHRWIPPPPVLPQVRRAEEQELTNITRPEPPARVRREEQELTKFN